jgi:hypothetical protein
VANREHKPYPNLERLRSTRPEDGMGRLQMENPTAVPADVGRYPTEIEHEI